MGQNASALTSTVGDLPLLTPAERAEIVGRWNDTSVAWPAEGEYVDLLREQARIRPGMPAVVHRGVVLSYAELDERTNRVASLLARRGVTAGDRVGVFCPRSADFIVAVLGVLKAGGAAVLLDPVNPDARIGHMTRDSDPVLVLTPSALAGRPPAGVPVVAIDGAELEAEPAIPPGVRISGDMVSHLIYTSGSTGQPKAVLERHAALTNLVHWTGRAYQVLPGDRASWLSTPGFAVQLMEWMPYLALGAAVHIADPAEVETPVQVRDWLLREKITHTMLVAALAAPVWRLTWPGDAPLRIMVTTAERAPEWPPADRPFRVVMTYGSTETTNVLSCLDLGAGIDLTSARTPAEVQAVRPVPVGRPIANQRVYILDPLGRPVPAGVTGRLYVAGAGLAAGYHNAPGLTARKFRANHLAEEPSAVLFDTGDLARYRDDGAVEVLGRSDSQVKVRGYRVELGEVEAALAGLPGVQEAAVVAHPDATGNTRLVAFAGTTAAPPSAARPTPRDMRRQLSRGLPEYMVPDVIAVCERLPRLPNGKVDLQSLRDQAPRLTPEAPGSFVAPRGPLEQQLAAMWQACLGRDAVGVHDDFFESGGHSLAAVQLIESIRQAFGVEVSLTRLRQHPTVAELAGLIDASAGRAEFSGMPPLVPDPGRRFDPFPLNDSQQALWVGRGDAVEMGNVGCHGYFEWDSDDLDLGRFERAWRRLVERHDALRTVIRPDGTQQVLRDLPEYRIAVLDLRGVSDAAAAAELARVRETLAHQVMADDQWPLFDLRITRLPGGRRIRMHLSLDMLIVDAWSYLQVLVPDLVQLYEQPDAELAPLRLTFRDYVLGVAASLEASEAYQRSRRYWLDRLATLPPAPQLPGRPAWQASLPVRFDRRAHQMGSAEWSALKARSSELGLTPSGLLTAAFAEVLRRWSGQDRFTINFPLFNRLLLHPDVNKLVGDTTTTLLVAVENPGGTFADRARDVQRQLWADLEHRYFNGVQVLRELARMRGNVRAAMPIVLTSLLGHPPRHDAAALGEPVYSLSQTPQVSVDFQIFEVAGELRFNWDFLPAMFPDGLIEDMFGAYCDLLHRLAADPAAWQSASFDMLPGYQRALRRAVNDTAAPVREIMLPELLAEQARRRPDALAVVDPRRRLDFARLRAEAGLLGDRIRATADGAELVAVAMEKGWEQCVAVYGVLEAGAAYLPIDPGVPPKRLRRLLELAGARAVLTQPWLRDTVQWPAQLPVLTVEPADGEPVSYPGDHDDRRGTGPGLPTDPAYVIFTSGSTGEPKGVTVDHRAVVNHVDDVNGRLGITHADRAMATAALHFDMSVYDMFGLPAAGGRVVLPGHTCGPDPDHWLDVAEREAVTFWAAVPALMSMVVARAEETGRQALRSLRTVVLAGDWIPLDLPDRLRALAPGVTVVSCGGPTETVNWSIAYQIGDVDRRWSSIPYGKPMSNHRYYILDNAGSECPLWVPGEMYDVSTVGLAQGYWRDPERTARSFVLMPGTHERAYATGDRGRYLPDGNLEILGRVDFQVKVQGHRIELGEIESTLRGHPAVLDAVVIAIGEYDSRQLVAHVVVDPDQAVTMPGLRAHLAERLPAYMVPPLILPRDALPLSANGKVDRRALAAEPLPARQTDAREIEDSLVRSVMDIWEEALHVRPTGPTDSFFDMGGNSMLAAQVARRLKETFKVDIPLRTVFDLQTVLDVAADVRERIGRDGAPREGSNAR